MYFFNRAISTAINTFEISMKKITAQYLRARLIIWCAPKDFWKWKPQQLEWKPQQIERMKEHFLDFEWKPQQIEWKPQQIERMKTPANLNFRRTSIVKQKLQNPQIFKTPKSSKPPNRRTSILAPDLVLAPRLHLSSLTPINFQQNVSSNFELFWFSFRFFREREGLRYEYYFKPSTLPFSGYRKTVRSTESTASKDDRRKMRSLKESSPSSRASPKSILTRSAFHFLSDSISFLFILGSWENVRKSEWM